ncbi:nibrin [Gouania willdenowi]|uniref:Nibrin n=1 Tax=Gouania willdenowi TaxID=441366 RepID=A0A8C5GE21_GOUWI|nr:nibrin [Gouania willdenowi]
MWILTPEQPGGEIHYLLCNKEYVVGRKNCDILLPSDQSISRAHAHLSVSAQDNLIVKDVSKYGTFVNSRQITAPVELKSGDKVTFGVFHSKFSVMHLVTPVVCSSSLNGDGKAVLSQALLTLGGKLVNNWTQDCTHLVMPSVKVTIKTISALLCCRPIVKPEFFSELSRTLQQKSAPPKAESFLPEMDEPSLNKEQVNLGAIPARKQLFTGKTFIFLSAKQLKRLSAAVAFGGGRCQQLEEGHLPRSLLESPQSCVVDLATGSSQTALSTSAVEWANSVKIIVERKGLRVITESEIGLAAIYASCERNCNPSNLAGSTGPEVKPRILSASLSQNMAVDETALLGASQNITAYAVNTEATQGCEVQRMEGVTSVGETPEKKQNQDGTELSGSHFTVQRSNTQYVVSETISSSIDIVQSAGAQKKKPEATLTGGGSSNIRPQPSSHKTNGGPKAVFYKQSPQKLKTSSQTSPQKQSTLTSFFQSVSKKRPLDDELSAVTSEPKRPTLGSINAEASKTSTTSNLGSASDLFAQPAEPPTAANTSRKRKVMEEDIHMEELESIMSEDMDCFEVQLSGNRSKEEEPSAQSPFKQNQVNTEESSNKKQRVHQEGSGGNKQQLQVHLKTGPEKRPKQQSEPNPVHIKMEQTHPTDHVTVPINNGKKPSQASVNTIQFEDDDDASFVEALEVVQADKNQAKEETHTQPVPIKQEVQESKIDEDLPKKLVLVEFRSLTVTAPLPNKPKQKQDSSNTKNFKCFRKNNARQNVTSVIGKSDLLVHSRGQNSDLDEWLKDAAEEEVQKKREEAVGNDLFRYNPTKQSRRR